ncbi:lysophospholipid acyltransferase family protein [Roseomonas sp. E05]|uniref:lysophospholipid acyltransferase family protein n=1 Tax=Roseomonas sp. E05 TaxID=3046310 RepID=UPI0024BB8249|nr:lysophospholipid acyltransferase family protein [Roseomonas sp. E05]MDJ0386884.1 lysophospholipid acyltransferase family protein [Roseomonas sp. E05]
MDPRAAYSPSHLAFYDFMFSRFFRRHMRALRVAEWGMPEVPEGVPLVVFANHPSWWDGVAFMLLSRRLFPGRRMFIPMEAAALARYRFMLRLGVFGVDTSGPRGAAAFLRAARQVLAPEHDDMLWMNAPGRFADARERPVPIAPGLTRLAELAPQACFVPLALEYPFWTERKAEMLAAFGPPLRGAALQAMPREARAEALATALAGVMDRLAGEAIRREPARFRVVEQGKEGMGGIYDRWRHLRARLAGRRFDPRHEARE